jgi:adenylosuccinate synthase
MPVDIVVGGQAGDEGKGKISAYLAYTKKHSCCVRIGGPNAGHTTVVNGREYVLRNLPAGFVNPEAKLVLGTGCYTKTEWLLKEIEITKTQKRVLIDPHVIIIGEEQTKRERENTHMMNKICSVGTGLGQAVVDRINRCDMKFAKDVSELKDFICDIPQYLNKELSKGNRVLLEGTQGIKLSLLHGEYPYVTSRDTTAGTFLAEAGLGPRYTGDVYAVFKPYVTRVGNGGPLKNEITKEKELTYYHTKGGEVGSVSGRKRRIGAFEFESALKTIRINSANKIAVTHIDMFKGNNKVKNMADLTGEAKSFLSSLKPLTDTYPYPEISLISTGPELLDVLEVKK